MDVSMNMYKINFRLGRLLRIPHKLQRLYLYNGHYNVTNQLPI